MDVADLAFGLKLNTTRIPVGRIRVVSCRGCVRMSDLTPAVQLAGYPA